MLILLAESKTMAEHAVHIMNAELTSPLFKDAAQQIMHNVAKMDVHAIITALKVTPRIAIRVNEMAKNFDYMHPIAAIESYTGIVFKYLDYNTLTSENKEYANSSLCIISSVYGLLKPMDAVVPYRMEYGAKIYDGKPLKQFWKPKVTVSLGKYLKENTNNEILAVLPSDAIEYIDHKLLRRLGLLSFIDIKTYHEGKLTSPSSSLLKEKRGLLIRNMIEQRIHSASELKKMSSPNFEYVGELKYPGYHTFVF